MPSSPHPPRAQQGGHVDHRTLAKGPNGRSLCRRCAREVPKGRLTFCSAECVREWSIRTNPAFAKARVFERDRGVCASCGRQCGGRIARGGHRMIGADWEMDHIVPVCEGGGSCGLENLQTLCRACHKQKSTELARKRAAARRSA